MGILQRETPPFQSTVAQNLQLSRGGLLSSARATANFYSFPHLAKTAQITVANPHGNWTSLWSEQQMKAASLSTRKSLPVHLVAASANNNITLLDIRSSVASTSLPSTFGAANSAPSQL